MNPETQQLITLAIAILGLLISLYLLYINIKNRETQLSTYRISRNNHRSSQIVLQYISSEQLNEHFLVKLVLFNPGSIASIIHSFSVFESIQNQNRIFRIFKPIILKRIEDARWWPTLDENEKDPRYLDENYKDLYVKDYRVILVSIPGWMTRERYEFEIRTNNEYVTHKTHIDGIKGTRRFSHHYEVRYAEK